MTTLRGLVLVISLTLTYSLVLLGVWLLLIGKKMETDPEVYADLEEMSEAVRATTNLLVPYILGNELLLIRAGGDVRKRLTPADWPRLDEHIAEAINYGYRENGSSVAVPQAKGGEEPRCAG